MTAGRVVLVGGGPGAPDLLTVRAARVLAAADIIVWGRPFAPEGLVREYARADAEVIAWPPATAVAIHAAYDRAASGGLLVARLFSGDPALFSRLGDEIEAIEARGLAWEVVPGITTYAAVAARLGRELTEGTDWGSLVVTSVAGAARAAESGSALAVYMAGREAPALERVLRTAGYAPDTACVLALRVGWPEETIVACPLAELVARTVEHDVDGLTTILVAARTR